MGWFGRTEGKELRFDLTDMRLFLTVVEQGSLTKGAEIMNLALASVSERISGWKLRLARSSWNEIGGGSLRLRPVMP
jgi:DNA-binding transcriptional LysR family regulator